MAKRTNKEELLQTDIVLTAGEMNALDDEKGELWKFYITISRRRDFATGIAGERTKISAQALKEAMSLTKKQGRPAFKVSGGSLENWIKKLVEIGLLIDKGNYIFELPFSPIYNSVKNKSDRSQTIRETVSQTLSNNAETSIKTDTKLSSERISQTASQTGGFSEVRSPLNNNLTKLNYTKLPVDNFLSVDENKMLNLYTDLKLNVKLAGDLKAITSAKTLIQAGVSLEVASQALKIKINGYYEKYPNGKTPHPSYFTDAILDYHRDLETLKQQPEENNNARRTEKPIYQPDRRTAAYQRLAAWAEKEDDGQENDTDFI